MQGDDKSNPEYWNKRVLDSRNDIELLYLSTDYQRLHDSARDTLSEFVGLYVIELGCGPGRFAPLFDRSRYRGFDSSTEMIRLAQKRNPKYQFEVRDMRSVTATADVIFQVICLSSFGMTHDEFIERFRNQAKTIISIEPDSIKIQR